MEENPAGISEEEEDGKIQKTPEQTSEQTLEQILRGVEENVSVLLTNLEKGKKIEGLEKGKELEELIISITCLEDMIDVTLKSMEVLGKSKNLNYTVHTALTINKTMLKSFKKRMSILKDTLINGDKINEDFFKSLQNITEK